MGRLILDRGDFKGPGFGTDSRTQHPRSGMNPDDRADFSEDSALAIETAAHFSFKFTDLVWYLGVHHNCLHWLTRRHVRI